MPELKWYHLLEGPVITLSSVVIADSYGLAYGIVAVLSLTMLYNKIFGCH